MPATRYKIWGWGNESKQGVHPAFHVGVTTRAKIGAENCPFVVANELIALRLASILGLPVPEGVIIEHDGKSYFASMNFNLDGFNLPPADEFLVARDIPDLACGVLAFDIWIVNADRHHGNLHYINSQKKLYMIDHSESLFEHEGISRLRKMKDNIGIGPHCLLPHIESLKAMRDWVVRILQIPIYYIRNAILEAVPLGIPISVVDEYVDFLISRREMILQMVIANKARFASADLFFDVDLAASAAEYSI